MNGRDITLRLIVAALRERRRLAAPAMGHAAQGCIDKSQQIREFAKRRQRLAAQWHAGGVDYPTIAARLGCRVAMARKLVRWGERRLRKDARAVIQ